MASPNWLETGINAYVRDLITPRLISTTLETKPLLRIMAGRDVTALSKLGDPDYGVILGGRDLGRAQRMRLNGSKRHLFRYETEQLDPAESVLPGEATPASSKFAEDSIGTAGTSWSHFWNPLKIREDTIDDIQNGPTPEARNLMIAEVVEETVARGFQRALDESYDTLWTGTLTLAEQQSNHGWKNNIGLTHWVDDGVATAAYANVGAVDRTTETELKARVVTATNVQADSALASAAITLDTITVLKYTGIGASSGVDYGQIGLRKSGGGDLCIVPPDMFITLKAEAQGKHRIVYANETQNIGLHGFKNPVIMMDDVMVTLDQKCPAGEIYLLTTSSWVYEVQAGKNYVVEPWVRKWQFEEGGHYYRWTNIHAKTRFTCREPHLQIKGTGFTA